MATAAPRRLRGIVLPLAFAETLVWGAFFYSFPALLPVWEQDLGWSKTDLSLAFTLALVVSAAFAPLAGRLIDHGWGHLVLLGGSALGALFLALLSLVDSLWQFYALWIGLGLVMSGTLYEACFALIMRCLGPDARRTITLVTLIAGLAGTLAFPSAHSLSEAFGWRITLVVFAIAVVTGALPLFWIAGKRMKKLDAIDIPIASARFTQALWATKSGIFWLLALAYFLIALDHGMVISHFLPLLADRGVGSEAAVLAATMIGPMQVAGRMAMIAAERHLSARAISLGCYLALGLAAASLFGAGAAPGLVAAFVLLQGAGNGVTSIIRPVVTSEMMGRRDYGVISGLLAVAFTGGIALAPIVAALIWEAGGYDLVLGFAIFICLVGFLTLALAWKLRGEAHSSGRS
jgi:MFS family permease